MSLFDKDIIEKPLFIPKEDSIEYTIKWLAEIICNRLSSQNSLDKLSPTYSNPEFCRDYIKFIYTKFFDDLMDNKLPTMHPGECKEYPLIYGYNIDVEYKVPFDGLGGNIYDIYLNYRINSSFYYVQRILQICVDIKL